MALNYKLFMVIELKHSKQAAQLNGKSTGKKTPSFKALKNIYFFTSSKYLVKPLSLGENGVQTFKTAVTFFTLA